MHALMRTFESNVTFLFLKEIFNVYLCYTKWHNLGQLTLYKLQSSVWKYKNELLFANKIDKWREKMNVE